MTSNTRTVAIVGRPNVGKSTLFNRLVGRRSSLVHDLPGVTRDWKEGSFDLGAYKIKLIDTAGLEQARAEELEGRMFAQTQRVVENADVVMVIVDGQTGIVSQDIVFANWLRKIKINPLLVVNKTESRAGEAYAADFYSLGFGEPIHVAAEHGLGIGEVYQVLAEELNKKHPIQEHTEEIEPEEDRPIKLSFLGRPNVGKSTLINALIGEDRLLTGPEAGITRDTIEVPFEFEGHQFELVDTAGLRKKAKIHQRLEKLSVSQTISALQYTEIVVMVMDARQPLDKQDMTVLQRIENEGRAVVIALNKWDLVSEKSKWIQAFKFEMDRIFTDLRGVRFVPVSAKHEQNLDKLMQTVVGAYKVWNKRLPTAKLNEWLAQKLEAHPLPLIHGRRLTIKYMTQVKARPPTFAFFTTRPEHLPEDYVRYLKNGLRVDFDMPGVPIRFVLRKRKNPYQDK